MVDLREALDAAIAASLSAGARLRAEFHRAGGPRGADGHAAIDAAVELDLRATLGGLSPGWGVRGEERPELDRPPSDPEQPVWLLDPNDGTHAFLRGHRGPCVSIGLVRRGLPVLGVIYSYAAPDDAGDLLAWAEGCGPVTRDGHPVETTLPTTLGPEHTVAVSDAADRKPGPSGDAAAPARYRPEPGMARRLALLAAGDVQGAVSLGAPRDFDLAAGHALLRGVGGELVDEAGRPVRYSADAPTRTRFAFGGSSAVAAQLARIPWADILAAPIRTPRPSDPLRPHAEYLCPDAELVQRAQGAWLSALDAGLPNRALRRARAMVRAEALPRDADDAIAAALLTVNRPDRLDALPSPVRAAAACLRASLLGASSPVPSGAPPWLRAACLGAMRGREGLPAGRVNTILTERAGAEPADWTVDALILAEALISAG